MKAQDYFEEKKSNMRELWNLSDTQKEMIYLLMEQYAALHKTDVMALLPSSDDIKKAFPIMDEWSIEDKCFELGKIRGAEWMLYSIKVRLGNKP